MSLALFLRQLTERTHVEVGAFESGEGDPAAAEDALREMASQSGLEMAFDPPALSIQPAVWAARLLYRSCQFLVFREAGPELVESALGIPCPEPLDARTHFSVDLTFRFLPDVIRLARAVAPDDPLVLGLVRLAREWPLSSAGVREAGPVERSVVAAALRGSCRLPRRRVQDRRPESEGRCQGGRRPLSRTGRQPGLLPGGESRTMSDRTPDGLELGKRLADDVLASMKRTFVGKDEIIDLLGVCLVAGEHLFILGPPGTAKTALVHELGRHLEGRTFDYLLTRFTEPNELFGPFDIRRLREGDLVTNTEGMLPEADLVFLDELLNANSAILNSLLLVLNERIFRRGRETRGLPLLMAVGASNRLPEDETIGALFDRFLLRVRCDNVPGEQLPEVLSAGWKLDMGLCDRGAPMTVDDARRLHALLTQVQLQSVRPDFVSLVQRVRHAGIPVSDRRAVKMQRLVAASALLCGRMEARVSDLWVFRYIWDTQEQREVLAGIVKDHIKDVSAEAQAHPRARQPETPDPDELARSLEHIAGKLADAGPDVAERACLMDRLSELSARCQWIQDEKKRVYLHERIEALWPKLRGAGA